MYSLLDDGMRSTGALSPTNTAEIDDAYNAIFFHQSSPAIEEKLRQNTRLRTPDLSSKGCWNYR